MFETSKAMRAAQRGRVNEHARVPLHNARSRKSVLLCASAIITLAATPAFAQTFIVQDVTVNSSSPLSDTAIFIAHTPNSRGSLVIESGGQVTTNTAEVGGATGSRGFITIQDAGSSWTSNGLLTLADGGEAVMRVLGGSATTNGIEIGAVGQGPGGRIVVDNAAGAGSTWQNTGVFAIGKFDTGEVLIQNNGVFSNNGNVVVADSVNSSGSRIDVTNGGVFNITGDSTLTLGNNRTGSLDINTGGVVDIAGAGAFVSGVASSSRSNIITVENAGSSLSVETFTLAEAGQSELNINAGGVVNVSGVYSMATVAGSQATANLDGANTQLTATGGAVIGNDGSASMTLRNGAVFEAGADTTLGAFTGSSINTGNGTVAVIGSGSAFNVTSGDLTLGLNGDADVTVRNGATMEVQGLTYLGRNNGSSANLEIRDAGSRFDSAGNVIIGENGDADLLISNGGLFARNSVSGILTLAEGATSTAVVTVEGAGSELRDAGSMTVGLEGDATLTIRDGGFVNLPGSGALLRVGSNAGSTGAINISDAGSKLTVQGLRLGREGQGDMSITNGGEADLISATLGELAGSQGALTIDGAGSLFEVFSDTRVGEEGAGAFTITNGGVARTASFQAGRNTGSNGEVIIDGANSRLEVIGGNVIVGNNGDGSITVRNGGALDASGAIANGFGTFFGSNQNGVAVLNIGAAAGDAAQDAGTVDLGFIAMEDGDASIAFNHTDTDYVFASDVETDRTGSAPGGSSHTIDVYSGVTTMTGTWDIDGATTVHGGRLNVNGDIVGELNVLGGAIGGSGAINALSLPTGATLAPGNSIGTMTVNNDLSFADGSFLEIEVNDADASDLVDVGGAVTIGNNVDLEVLPENGTDTGATYNERTEYVFIEADGGITGEFATVTENFAFLDAEVTIENGEATLTLVRATDPDTGGDGGGDPNNPGGGGDPNNPDGPIIEFGDVAVSGNQRSIARSLEALGSGAELYDVVVGLSEAQARNAFDQLSGEVHASALASVMQDSRIIHDIAIDRLRDADNEDGLSVWASAYGSWGTWDESGDNTAAELDRSTAGFVFGADVPLFDSVRLGAMIGVAGGDIDIEDRGSEADIGTVHFGAYADWDLFKAVTLSTGLLNSWNDLETERAVDISGFNSFSDRLTAEYNANVFQLFAEAGYAFDLGKLTIEPYVGLAYASLDADEISEAGGSARLASAEYDMETTFSTIGARAEYGFQMFGANAALEGGLAWRHAFDDTLPRQSFSFAGTGQAFTTEGVPLAEDAAIIDLGLNIPLANRIGAGLGYNGQLGDGVSDHGVRANIRFNF